MTTAELVSSQIEQMNREREDMARNSVRRCLEEIVKQQGIIKSAQSTIANCREALARITVEPVNAKDVLG